MKKAILLLVIAMVMVATAYADKANYLVTVKDNGEALVILTINGTGLYKVGLQEDVSEVKVKGGLYSIDNKTAEVSIGSTGKAIVLYKTSTLTNKIKDKWALEMNLLQTNYTECIFNFASNVRILDSSPNARFEETDYKKVIMEGKFSHVTIDYSFSGSELPTIEENITNTPTSYVSATPSGQRINNPAIIVALGVVAALPLLVFLKKRGVKQTTVQQQTNQRQSNKTNIIKTLPRNEESIVQLLIENSGSMKRNLLEKNSKIAKSSLASSLQNLEKKKIVEIDRTYTTHFVKLTQWFLEL